MASIQILIGSIYGGAEQVAEIAAARLRELDHEVSLNTYARPQDLVRDSNEVLLLCHSNTGAGELPDNIQPIYLHLTRDYPRIAGKRYGVINLGDSSYSTFNEAGRMLDAAFADLGAVRIGEPLVLDACSGDSPEALTLHWVNTWAQQL
ncbi:sulfite reductase [Cellvibrio zantedeschiae]|uniref:Sulfite reductase n=1 Tax=Cellvibrio zantedeschiae TaxID=1237077 RepID=A0ABQ3AV70_9GAMM|nr:flavodoxin domain-containing protein [Cellvibrio zantedeschiae]GGY67827.1 sulfite reductase [Cellvibrio zantedeschiae]